MKPGNPGLSVGVGVGLCRDNIMHMPPQRLPEHGNLAENNEWISGLNYQVDSSVSVQQLCIADNTAPGSIPAV